MEARVPGYRVPYFKTICFKRGTLLFLNKGKINMKKKEFINFLIVNEISIPEKNMEYYREECRINSDYLISNMKEKNSQDISLSYLELSKKVKKDFSKAKKLLRDDLYALNNNQIKIMEMTMEWAESKYQSYMYYSNYLTNGNPEDIDKFISLREETENKKDEILLSISKL